MNAKTELLAALDAAAAPPRDPLDHAGRLVAVVGFKGKPSADLRKQAADYKALMQDPTTTNFRALAKEDQAKGVDSLENCLAKRQAKADASKRTAFEITVAAGPECVAIAEVFAKAIEQKADAIEQDEKEVCAEVGFDFEPGPTGQKLRDVARAVRLAASSINSPARRLPWLPNL